MLPDLDRVMHNLNRYVASHIVNNLSTDLEWIRRLCESLGKNGKETVIRFVLPFPLLNQVRVLVMYERTLYCCRECEYAKYVRLCA